MFDARRKYFRFDIPLTVEFKPSKDAQDYALGITNNFSREGLGFVTQRIDYQPRETFEMKVKLPDKDMYARCLAELVWKQDVDNKCRAGLRFREFDAAAKGDILECAYEQWLQRQRSGQ